MDTSIESIRASLQDLEFSLASHFLPAPFGVKMSLAEHDLLSLPLQMGALEIVTSA